MLPPVFYVCSACGAVVTLDASPGFRCPRRPGGLAGDAHRLVREIDPTRLHWPELGPDNPLLRYRQLTTPYLRFRLLGGSDVEYVEGVRELEASVEGSTGTRFRSSPVLRSEALELATGRESGGAVFVQDRGSFAGGPGSWQALLFALVPAWLGFDSRRLVTFDPADDSEDAVRLAAILEREVEVSSGGEPDVVRANHGAEVIPWTGWRDLNAWVMEGEGLWAFGAVDRLRGAGESPDRVFLSPDGGPAAGWILGVREALRLGRLAGLPRIHIVEREGSAVVRRRYDAVLHAILAGVDARLTEPKVLEMAQQFPRVRASIADRIVTGLRSDRADHPVREAVESGLRLVAEREGPGDDHADVLVRAMLESGGFPLAADGDEVIRGRMLSRREPPRSSGGSRDDARRLRVPGLSSAGMLRLFAHGDLPEHEVLLAVDP